MTLASGWYWVVRATEPPTSRVWSFAVWSATKAGWWYSGLPSDVVAPSSAMAKVGPMLPSPMPTEPPYWPDDPEEPPEPDPDPEPEPEPEPTPEKPLMPNSIAALSTALARAFNPVAPTPSYFTGTARDKIREADALGFVYAPAEPTEDQVAAAVALGLTREQAIAAWRAMVRVQTP